MTQTRVESVVNALRSMITNGTFQPGQRLTELHIAGQMNVSQVTVRDALRVLEREGWVTKTPRRGVTVRSFTATQAEEVFALIAAVESLALRWVMARARKVEKTLLRSHVKAARRAAGDHKPHLALAMLFELHLEIVRLTVDRPMTVNVLSRMHNHTRLMEFVRRARAALPLDALEALVTGHEALCDRIDADDANGAETELRRQITLYAGLIIDALKE